MLSTEVDQKEMELIQLEEELITAESAKALREDEDKRRADQLAA